MGRRNGDVVDVIDFFQIHHPPRLVPIFQGLSTSGIIVDAVGQDAIDSVGGIPVDRLPIMTIKEHWRLPDRFSVSYVT